MNWMSKAKKTPILQIVKCDVAGCTEEAVYGFRKLMDGNTLTTSGFKVESSFNCCEDHEAETAKEYTGPNIIRVQFKN
jgi:hypothetical protein